MLIVAERINATRKRIAKAIKNKNEKLIRKEARKQARSGADYIDVNAGSDPAAEVENLVWLTNVAQDATDKPLSLDSPNPDALKAAFEAYRGDDLIINSVTAEQARLDAVLPLVRESGAKVIALAMGDGGLPTGVDDRLALARKMADAAAEYDIAPERIYLDPCVQPVSTSPGQAEAALETFRRVKTDMPGVHTICGLSNVSFGLPYRNLVNRAFLTLALQAGMDAAIIDPTEEEMVATMLAAEAVLGVDEWCMAYVTAEREGRLRPDS